MDSCRCIEYFQQIYPEPNSGKNGRYVQSIPHMKVKKLKRIESSIPSSRSLYIPKMNKFGRYEVVAWLQFVSSDLNLFFSIYQSAVYYFDICVEQLRPPMLSTKNKIFLAAAICLKIAVNHDPVHPYPLDYDSLIPYLLGVKSVEYYERWEKQTLKMIGTHLSVPNAAHYLEALNMLGPIKKATAVPLSNPETDKAYRLMTSVSSDYILTHSKASKTAIAILITCSIVSKSKALWDQSVQVMLKEFDFNGWQQVKSFLRKERFPMPSCLVEPQFCRKHTLVYGTEQDD